MNELFIVGTFWFWLLLVVEFVLLFVLVENDLGIAATASLVVVALCLQFGGNVDVFRFILHNPGVLFLGAVAYFAAGTCWGVGKWYLFCRDELEEYLAKLEEWKQYKKTNSGYAYEPTLSVPQASAHKSDIIRWMTFWPVSLLWSIVDDFIRGIFRRIYQQIAALLQRISDRVFADVMAKEDKP